MLIFLTFLATSLANFSCKCKFVKSGLQKSTRLSFSKEILWRAAIDKFKTKTTGFRSSIESYSRIKITL